MYFYAYFNFDALLCFCDSILESNAPLWGIALSKIILKIFNIQIFSQQNRSKVAFFLFLGVNL